MMKSSSILKMIISTSIVTTGLLVLPQAQAADPATTGTIHVVQEVINDNAGTNVAGDFSMNVKHYGVDVVGSPFVAIGGTGTTFVLEPGTYVVSQSVIDGYDGTWSGVGVDNGFIDLVAGQEITITRTLNDNGKAVVIEPTTEDGGVLPNTASPWFNALAVGLLISVAGVFGVKRRSHQSK
jgi:LPXTG-motif cell wall-anchored protein